ncbi:hypothetical protein TMatcc_007077 [Talaromyces marneffei ATCC 18224]|uniref:Stress-response A/B barrel domain-containing protein n=1 Tax=Talaromyces marneffei (strain ATCC 18224 / CBS 334.59 / QM 7333) TaxID=441960 RepID=B6QER7_TALMQ|nr:uncharacterized protein EYB26_004066 [Talaromyces marneffei]EEA24004.1 conserved hypothetical protein [Talaromyces marneffei ATCC 18224]KAE8553486.1 hypothetical protein EYB25_004868 [Talaromyces marneffei]QGA16399.1 hypothetical protein EYB26_004066 [Talaromyces marneffei]
MGGKILRVTMFKIPGKENQLKLAENYKKLSTEALKDGKPYILSLQAGPTIEDSRSNGFTFVAKTEFASLEDMKYYDDEDQVHLSLKKTALQMNIQEIVILYAEPLVTL